MRPSQQGATLIELMIGVVIFAILLAAGIPSFSTWLQNAQIRTAAQSIQNGLQIARAEALHRNSQVRFTLTSSLDNSCVDSTSGPNWAVSLSDPAGGCGAAPSITVTAASPAPQIIQTRSGAEGSAKAVVSADQSSVIFNGLGQALNTLNVCVGVNGVDPANCYYATNVQERHLKVIVTTGGQVRLCDPKWTISQDPQGC